MIPKHYAGSLYPIFIFGWKNDRKNLQLRNYLLTSVYLHFSLEAVTRR